MGWEAHFGDIGKKNDNWHLGSFYGSYSGAFDKLHLYVMLYSYSFSYYLQAIIYRL